MSEDAERLARMEEKLTNLVEDIKEIKSNSSSLINTMSTMHKDYVPRKELEEKLNNIEEKVGENTQDIKELRQKINSRPPWSISIIITSLSTITVGLIVYVVTK
jgi:regulator of replication initiation timing